MNTAGSYQGIETAPDRPGYSVSVTDAAGHVWADHDPGWSVEDADRYARRTSTTEPPGRTVHLIAHRPGHAPCPVASYATEEPQS